MTPHTQKHMAVWDWIYTCKYIAELHFTQGEYNSDGDLVLNNQVVYTPDSIGSDAWVKRCIRNTGIKEYSFTLSQYVPMITHSNDSANIKTFEIMEKISEWTEEQNRLKNFPIFPNGCRVIEIKSFPASIAGRDEHGCKIQSVIKIIYEQKQEENT